jgi:UDP-N-acetylglucosamine acyltransferase
MATPRIHPTALVEAGAELAADVEVGAFTLVGAHVRIGAGTRIGPHAVVTGRTTLGARNRIFQYASIGEIAQDRKYGGEPVTTTIGDDNVFREFVTVHSGTAQDRGDTRIGDGNWFLAYTHVAHDCVVGNRCVFSNNATLAGHVTVGDHVILSGFVGIHQFCRIGAHAFIGMGAFVNGDVPPFVMVAQDGYGRPRGINAEGLKRRGFDSARTSAIKRAYRALYVSGDSLADARVRLEEMAQGSEDVRAFLDFIEAGDRPLLR